MCERAPDEVQSINAILRLELELAIFRPPHSALRFCRRLSEQLLDGGQDELPAIVRIASHLLANKSRARSKWQGADEQQGAAATNSWIFPCDLRARLSFRPTFQIRPENGENVMPKTIPRLSLDTSPLIIMVMALFWPSANVNGHSVAWFKSIFRARTILPFHICHFHISQSLRL